jgi:hypothetical protein
MNFVCFDLMIVKTIKVVSEKVDSCGFVLLPSISLPFPSEMKRWNTNKASITRALISKGTTTSNDSDLNDNESIDMEGLINKRTLTKH